MLLERPAIAVMPAVSHLMGAGEMPKAKGVLLRLMRIILWLLGMVSAGFMLFNDDFIALWVGQNFFAGQSVNAVLAMTVFFGVLVTSLSSLCFSLGNIKKNSFASLAQSLLSVPLIMLGAKYWGFLGVALATLIAMLAVSAWYYPYAFCRLLSVSRLEISAFARDAFAVVFAATLVSFAFASIPANSWPTLMISVSAYCLGYTVLLMLISKGFRDELMSLLHGKNPMASRTEGIT